MDAENYANLTRPWFASRSPFPLNFLVPSRHANNALCRILLSKVESPLYSITEVEGKVNRADVLHTVFPFSAAPCLSVCFSNRCFLVLHQLYSDAKECLNLLSHRLGGDHYFFGNSYVLWINIYILVLVGNTKVIVKGSVSYLGCL